MDGRRQFLKTAALAAIGGAVPAAFTGCAGIRGEPSEPAGVAPRPATPVSFDMPRGATDTHVHVVGPTDRYPFVSPRTYTPPPASVDELNWLHRRLGIERVVVVQPSFYGTDNRCTLDAMRAMGAKARGVVVLGNDVTAAQMDEMHALGVRAVRVNLETAGVTDPAASGARLRAAVQRIAGRPWHIQIFTRPSLIAALRADFMALPVPVVLDHFAGANGVEGFNEPGFGTVLELVKSGRAYVKISAPYRISKNPPLFSEYAPLAKALIAANPDRILWGSNWPHPNSAQVPGRAPTDIAPWRTIDDGAILNLLPGWESSATMRRRILADNPARLFGWS